MHPYTEFTIYFRHAQQDGIVVEELMFNLGMEILFLTALAIVAIMVLLFYAVVVRLGPKPDSISPKSSEKTGERIVETPTETEAVFLKRLPEDLASAPDEDTHVVPEALVGQETTPAEAQQTIQLEPPETVSTETPERPLEPASARAREAQEPVPEVQESPGVAPAEAPRDPGPAGCPYHLGYLRSRPKDSFVPDVCLSCPRILDCLHKKWLE